MKKLVSILLFLFISICVQAATITVTNKNDAGAGSLRDAVAISAHGDIIRFADTLLNGGQDTVYLTSEIFINKNVTIIGLYNNIDTLFVSGSGTNRVFNINITVAPRAITFDSLCITDGYYTIFGSGRGGAIYFTGDNIFIENSLIQNSQCRGRGSSYGGGIYSDGNIVIENCTLKGNYAYSSPTAIFSNFSTYSYGGGLYVTNGYGTLINCIVDSNEANTYSSSSTYSTLARSYGGGAYFSDSSYIINSNITKNEVYSRARSYGTYDYATCYSYGGGIYCNQETEIQSTSINNNKNSNSSTASDGNSRSYNYGGGAFCNDTSIINNSTVSNNENYAYGSSYDRYAYGNNYGGGLFANNKSTIENTIISNNTNDGSIYASDRNGNGSSYGAGIYSVNSEITINKSLINQNVNEIYARGDFSTGSGSSYTYGAGIYIVGKLSIDSSEINYNENNPRASADREYLYSYGAGIYQSDTTIGEIKNSNLSFNKNSATSGNRSHIAHGGGGYFNNVSIDNCLVSNNTNTGRQSSSFGISSDCYGGGIYVIDYININKTTISKNQCNGERVYGGGVYQQTNSACEIKNSTLVFNHISSSFTTEQGSGLYQSDTLVEIKSSIIALNTGSLTNIIRPITVSGYNVFGDIGIIGSVPTDQLGATSDSLNLDTLNNNGGLYFTHLPGAGSVAINKGTPGDFVPAHNSVINYGRRESGAAETTYCSTLENQSIDLCPGDSFVSPFNNYVFNTNGVFYDTLLRHPIACDSVILYNVNLRANYVRYYNYTACDSIILGTKTYTTTGNYIDTFSTIHGCDSIVNYNITINPTSSSTQTFTHCGFFISPSGKKWTSSGIYRDTITNSRGCDSLMTFNMTIDTNSYTNYTITICDSLVSPTGKVWKVPGTFYDTLPLANGCDSILVYNLSVNYSSIAEVQKLVASDRKAVDHFSYSVSIDGNYAVIGARYEDEDASGLNSINFAGSAYVYEKNGVGNWIEVQKLVASDRFNSDLFGNAVSISGNYIIVGAYYESHDTFGSNTRSQAGSAYVFERAGSGVWNEVQKLVASDRNTSDRFGESVSISGNKIVIGASNEDQDASGNNFLNSSGSAYVFERDGSGVWNEVQKIVASDRGTGDLFGFFVSISGNKLVVGANGEDEDINGLNSLSLSGSAYVFERTKTGVWNEVQKLVASDRGAGDQFGISVSIEGNTILIGALREDEDTLGTNTLFNSGSAYIFERDVSGVWNQKQKLVASDRAAYDEFGESVSIRGNHAVIGAYFEDEDTLGANTLNSSGSAYIFERDNTGNWNQLKKLVTSDRGANDYFGRSISISGNSILIGAFLEDEDTSGINTMADAGSAYIFEFTEVAPKFDTIKDTVCNSYTSITGKIYTSTGIYFDTIAGSIVCDSIIQYDIVVKYSSDTVLFETVCDSLISPSGKVWTTAGMYFDTISNASGCDSLFTITLSISPAINTTDVVTACDSLLWINGITYYAITSAPKDTLISSQGCDSIVSLNLTINNSSSSSQTLTVCDSLLSPSGKTWNSNGIYLDTINNSSGCDSLMTFNLTVNFTSFSSQTITVCDSLLSPSGKTWNATGTYFDTIMNASGCDSLMTFNLTVNYTSFSTQTITVCDSLLTPSGKTWNTTGNYLDTITNASGCDSLMTFNLTVNNSNSYNDVQIACDSFTWINGTTYFSNTNIPQDTILNSGGCDSIITLNLTINNSIQTTDIHSVCDSFTWINGATYYASTTNPKDTLTTINGCDSIVSLDLTISTTVRITQPFVACDSFGWRNGITYFSSNNSAEDTVAVSGGCDTIFTLDLTINNSSSFSQIVTVCDSLTSPSGKVWNASGTYWDTITNAVGCDSLMTFNLTVNHTTNSSQTITVCDSLVSPSGKTWNTTGTYLDTITNNSGCDSLMTFNLTVNSTTDTSYSVSVCDSLISPSGKTWSTSGNYFDTIPNTSGCDSLFTINLTILPTIYTIDNQTACDSLVWINGITYYASTSAPKDTLISSQGCDSIVSLNLTINNSSSSSQTLTVCDSLLSPSGKTWNSTGTYLDTINNSSGCDSLMTFNLTVNFTSSSSQTITVCDSLVSPSGKTWNTTGNYLDTIPNASGCDSLITFNLTVNFTSTSSQTITVCDSLLSPSGKTWNTTGNYLDTITNASGCDSLMTFNLTINSSNSFTDVQIACDSFTWRNGTTYYYGTNIPQDTILNTAGCDSIITLNLTINNSIQTTDIHSVCDSFTWINGVTYYASTTTPKDTLVTSNGCDSIIALNLTISSTVRITQPFVACDSFVWRNGTTYYATNNTAEDTVFVSGGCDTIFTLDLTINNSSSYSQTITVCDSLVSPSGKTWNATGIYLDTILNTSGCDSLMTFNLTVNSTTSSSQTLTVCDSLVSPTGKTWNSSGIYLDTIVNSSGCDSLMTFNLTVNYTTSSTQTTSVCDSLVSPSGKTWNSSGTYLDTILNVAGCDSLMTFNLTVNYTTSSIQTITVCDSLVSPSRKIWNSSGTYLDTITKSNGCDSLLTFNLTVNYTTSSSQTLTVCDSLTSPSGKIWRTNGIYLDTITNTTGCDSLMIFNLTIAPFSTVSQTTTICDSIIWRGETYTSSGTYYDTVLVPGCDTIFDLILTVNYASNSSQSITVCDSLVSPSGKTWNSSGTYLDTILNVAGCDSLMTFNLTVNYTTSSSQTLTVCDSLVSPSGKTWNTSGIYLDTIIKTNGCDSLMTFNLTINYSSSSTQTLTVCDSLLSPSGKTWTTSGTYLDTILNASGCDSLMTFNLTVNYTTSSTQSITVCDSLVSPSGKTWTTTGIYLDTILNVAGCDSLMTFNLTVNYTTSSTQTLTVCDSLVSPSGKTWNTSGTYLDTITKSDGCDSLMTFNLTVNYTTTSSQTISVCDSLLSPSGKIWRSSGTYLDTILNASGCDSLMTFNLTINGFTIILSSDTVCDSLIWRGVTYTTSGTYNDSILIPGCDTIYSLNLLVNNRSNSTINPSSCGPYSSPNGNTYTTSGTYTDTIVNTAGCDSIITINLTIDSIYNFSVLASGCDSFLLPGGTTAYSTGSYTDTLTSASGCDSIVTTNLFIAPSYSLSQTLNLCAGQTITIGGNTYGSTGIYRDTLTTGFGCDSIIETNLTINPLVLGTITFSRDFCEDEAPINFTATPVGGIWVGPGIDSTSGLFSPALAGVGTHTIVFIPNSPCPIADSVSVQVFSTPVINFNAEDELCDQSNGKIDLNIIGGTPAFIYTWSNGETVQNIDGLKEGTYNITVSDANNCTDMETISLINIIDPDCEFGIFVPNIFSPDGNGENDVLHVLGSGIEKVSFVIFNRYGNKIFESTDPDFGWDGTYKGSPANVGVFVYFVKGNFVNGEEFEEKGTVTLIRR